MNFLFACTHCQAVPSFRTLPLCEECLESLQNSHCGRFELGQPVDSAFGLYGLNDRNYGILKSWKKRRGPLFDRWVLKPIQERACRQWMNSFVVRPDLVTAIPQSLRRSMDLGSTPSSFIAVNFAKEFGLPFETLLGIRPRFFRKRQAELDSWQRLSSQLDFEWTGAIRAPRSVILIDDFVTTGHTLREAARALKLSGVRQVYVVGLGARVDSSAKALDAAPADGLSSSLAC